MEIELKSGPQGHIYLPKRIRENWDKEYKLTPNWKAGVIYPSDAKPQDILRSLETLTLEFKHRTDQEEPQK